LRRILVALTLLAVVGYLTPSVVSARGVPLKGRIIVSSTPVKQTTGSCSCVWPWYTFGMNSGRMTVTATMSTYQHALTPSWGIRLFVYHGSTLLGWSQAACWSKQKSCVRSISVSGKVKTRGIFYARVEGPGADGIAFTIAVKGPIYTLRCGATC
jgi:hypothetical protein